MTENHLSDLLHETATGLDVPVAPAGAILTMARRARRHRRTAVMGGLAGAVVVAGIGIGVAGLAGHGRPTLAAASAPQADGWAVAQGSTIHLGDGATATVSGEVKAMYYTSAGTLVRVGRSPYTDAPDSAYWLIRPDGSTVDVDLSLGDRKPGTDPSLPYIAYAARGSDARHWHVVLRDVRTSTVVRTIDVEGAFTWGGWEAPPVALSGDHVYVGMDKATLDVDWRTGRVAHAAGLAASRMPTTAGGRDLSGDESPARVVDAQTGKTLLTIRFDDDRTFPRLSADGRHVLMSPTATCRDAAHCTLDADTATVYDVDTGARQRLRSLRYGSFGWTPTGRLLEVDNHRVETCDVDSGRCASTPVRLDGTGPIRVSGNDNES